MSIEQDMREAVEVLRTALVNTDYSVQSTTMNAVVDEDADNDGKLDDNPDAGVGVEPGEFGIYIYKDGSLVYSLTEMEAIAIDVEGFANPAAAMAETALGEIGQDE